MTAVAGTDTLRDLYQEMILDHNRNPRNFGSLKRANRQADGFNPLCGDKITVYLHLKDDVIEDIRFQGSGCAISKASASIMTTVLKGKTMQQAKQLFREFHEMVTEGNGGSPSEKKTGGPGRSPKVPGPGQVCHPGLAHHEFVFNGPGKSCFH